MAIRPPARADGRKLRVPALRETRQGLLGIGEWQRRINGSQVGGHRLALTDFREFGSVCTMRKGTGFLRRPPRQPIDLVETVSQNFEPSIGAIYRDRWQIEFFSRFSNRT